MCAPANARENFTLLFPTFFTRNENASAVRILSLIPNLRHLRHIFDTNPEHLRREVIMDRFFKKDPLLKEHAMFYKKCLF